jgi:hypothetical protein
MSGITNKANRVHSSSTKTFKSTAESPRKRIEWNSYLTENQYKLDEERFLRRKQMLISKNNILLNIQEEKRSTHNKVKKLGKTRSNRTKSIDADSLISDLDALEIENLDKYDVNALDMLNNQAIAEHCHKADGANLKLSKKNACSSDDGKSKQFCSTVHRHGVSFRTAIPTARPTPSYAQSSIAATPTHSGVVSRTGNIFEEVDATDEDAVDISTQLKILGDELKYYEQLSGKKSVFSIEVRKKFQFVHYFIRLILSLMYRNLI